VIFVTVVHLVVLLVPASIAVLLKPDSGVWIELCGARSCGHEILLKRGSKYDTTTLHCGIQKKEAARMIIIDGTPVLEVAQK
jgi:hypothetical protein